MTTVDICCANMTRAALVFSHATSNAHKKRKRKTQRNQFYFPCCTAWLVGMGNY